MRMTLHHRISNVTRPTDSATSVETTTDNFTGKLETITPARTKNEYIRWLERNLSSQQSFVTPLTIDDMPALALVDPAVDLSVISSRLANYLIDHCETQTIVCNKVAQCYPEKTVQFRKRLVFNLCWATTTRKVTLWINESDQLPFDLLLGSQFLTTHGYEQLKRRDLLNHAEPFRSLDDLSRAKREIEMYKHLSGKTSATTPTSWCMN